MKSFIYPLIEETRADLSSHTATLFRAPICQIFDVRISKEHKPPKDLYYNLSLLTVRDTENGEVEYEPEVEDLIALTDVRPKNVNDLNRPKTSYLLAFVQGENEISNDLLILSSKPIVYEKNERKRGTLFAVSLTNLTTNTRIWNALNLDLEGANMNIIRKVLQPSHAVGGNCDLCSPETIRGFPIANLREVIRQFIKLDDSQEAAVLSCIATLECHHQNGVKLIWGPPGTGKTKTVASLLFALLRMKCRTLTCAPTNIAVLGVAARFMGMVQDTLKCDTYGLGDVLLFGNGKRMKIQDCEELHDVFLSKRVASLAACFAPFSGWKGSIDSMILLFEDPDELYSLYIAKEKSKGKDSDDDSGEDKEEEVKDEETLKGNIKKIGKESSKKGKEMSCQEGGGSDDADAAAAKKLTFEEFLVKRYLDIGEKLMNCITILYTHLPTSLIPLEVAKTLIGVNGLLQTLLHNVAVINEGENGVEEAKKKITKLSMCGTEILEILKALRETVSLPDFTEESTIRDFCIRHATLIFCTVSSSAKLHAEGMTPLELLVIDEAAQLKECESAIPLQLNGLRHAILVGDERQLPAMVQSKICENVEFGRSLFERLVLLGHAKHLLNVQYRMHPSISLFPNEEFYDKQISDGPNVKESTYDMRFLNGNMFGSYSFINVAKGREEFGNGHSPRNMVEVAVVAEIVAGLYNESVARKQRLSVGCISPYNAQVCFGDEFCNSMVRIKDVEIRKKVVSLLLKLSNGRRKPSWEKTDSNIAGVSSQLLEQYNVNGYLSLIWSVDVLKEASMHIQVIKVWDILPVYKIPDLARQLNIRKLVLPMTWPLDSDAVTLASFDQSESLASQLGALNIRNGPGSRAASFRSCSFVNRVIVRSPYRVAKIPKTFSSTSIYMKSFIYPLIEETHADLSSHMATLFRAPICQIFDVRISKEHKPPKDLYYNLSLMTVRDTENGEVEYVPEVGDLIALTDVRPKSVNDLNRPKTSYLLAFVQGKNEISNDLLILSSKPIVYEKNERKRGTLFAVSLTNLTTNTRIWNALNLDLEGANMNIIRKVLQPSHAVGGNCDLCSPETIRGFPIANLREVIRQFIKLDDSQEAAVLSCIATLECHHQNGVKLIWGPPGTGKTKTVASLLFALLRMKCRTLTCAPTNIAVLGVAARFMGMVQDTLKCDTYGLGDVLLFGNGKRMKIQDCEELHDVFLSKRVASLAACFAPFSGWKGSIDSMILLFEDPDELYSLYIEKEKSKGKDSDDDSGEDKEEEVKDEETLKGNIKKIGKESSKKGKEMSCQEGGGSDDADAAAAKKLTFEEFLVKRYLDIGEKLMNCITILYTHLPTSLIPLEVAKTLIGVNGLLQTLLHNVAVINEGENGVEEAKKKITKLSMCGTEILEILKALRETVSLPDFTEESTIRDFCIRHATLIFCTVSSSAKLHAEGMTPLELLVIDEAAQLKECESAIPLQLNGLRHAILVGDERQLPAMVQSKICENVEFGRSLFERLVLLGHAKHLLNVQYRMHPSISLFPNEEFYDKQISDGPNVKESTYDMRFLNGNMFGSYSFINVAKGREEFGNGHSPRNMVEVAVVAEIVAGLYNESVARKQRLSVGCISPYNAQVCFGDEFCNSMVRIKDVEIRKKVVSLLLKLSNGRRKPSWEKTDSNIAGVSSQLLEQYNVNGYLSLIWSVDVLKEASMHIQVIKVWDILPVYKIPDLARQLNIRFGNYIPNTIKLCKYRRVKGYEICHLSSYRLLMKTFALQQYFQLSWFLQEISSSNDMATGFRCLLGKRLTTSASNEKIRAFLARSSCSLVNRVIVRSPYRVAEIPKTFSSTSIYMKSFIYPLIEETRADLSSHMATLFRAPICQIFDVRISKDHKPPKDLYYHLSLMTVRDTENGEVEYEPEVGDLIALTDVRPKCVNDLNRPRTSYLLAFVQGKSEISDDLLILSSKPIVYGRNEKKRGMLFAVSLTNLTTNIRIWNALNLDLEGANTNIIRKVLQPSHAVGGNCTLCSPETIRGFPIASLREAIRQFIKLDDSQEAAVLSCIATRECHHQNGVKLIWGPPGTGKTKTVASLLFALLRMKCRTLTCAPTNIAVLGVAARFMGMVQDTLKCDTYGLGDVLLFGNGKRMKIQDCEELHDVFLSKRVASLAACFAPFSGWKGSIDSMILLFEDPEELYSLYIEKEKSKEKDSDDDRGEDEEEEVKDEEEEEEVKDEETLKGNIKKIGKESSKKGKEMSCQEGGGSDDADADADADAAAKKLTFEEFLVKRFLDIGEKLMNCITILYTHLPTSLIPLEVAKTLIGVSGLLQTLLHNVAVINEGLSEGENGVEEAKKKITKLSMCRTDFLEILKTLRETVSLPDFTEECTIRDFCLRHATLIFCTVSSAAKLHAEGMTPLELLVIDEAAQLKECESAIPLQLNGLRHAILVGDEKQLQAMVQSEICKNVEFGRSLFERLVLLGHGKHLLNVQYRMHPSISLFPNEEFYDKQILDGPNVKERTYDMRFLNGNMFGSYSFINVAKGREEFGNGHSPRNMVEVAVVAEIVAGLYKDVHKEASMHIQVIVFWDILPVYKIPDVSRHLNIRKLVLPMTWPLDSDALTLASYDPSESLASQLGALNIRN
ncbi:hypothetical protein RJ640_027034 [Escallonia rubra]|uniref:AAA+ ATPase domain-containing protein n=1 Tax=Escallonia rubra TaxID=112253 RepID=A0AA88QDF1_9ASTE|nr:hypothetical protein RJ640_027034 [Escallonia rubra]